MSDIIAAVLNDMGITNRPSLKDLIAGVLMVAVFIGMWVVI